MYNAYLKSILPVPIVDIEVSPKNNYVYRITALSSLVDESKNLIEKRLRKNKRIKSIGTWFFKEHDFFYKQLVIEFNREGE